MIRFLDKSEEGYTVTEMIVVVAVLGLLVGVFYSFLFGGDRAAEDGREWLELNQTARLALERMTRELREADGLVSVAFSPADMTFRGDYNANGTFTTTPTVGYTALYDPDETIRYRYDPGGRRVMISTLAVPTETALVDNVSAFTFTYFGSDPRADVGCNPAATGCVANDGEVWWQELDRTAEAGINIAGFGNDSNTFDGPEFRHTTSIVIDMTVQIKNQRHSYRTGVELRNLFG